MAPEAPLFVQLQSRLQELSRNQRVLAKYVLSHYQGVAFANVKELARLAKVSEATIVRFARVMGFSGYPSFQKEVRRIVRADLKGTERFKLGGTAVTAGSAGAAVNAVAQSPLQPVIRKELENINRLTELYDADRFKAAVTLLNRATRVVCVGSRSAAPLAQHLWFGLDKIGVRSICVLSISTETYDLLSAQQPGTCVVLFAFPRYLQQTLRLHAFLRQRGINVLAITDSPFSPVQGDVSLYAPVESAYHMGFHCAPLILVTALLYQVSVANRRRSMAALDRFEALAEGEGYFVKD